MFKETLQEMVLEGVRKRIVEALEPWKGTFIVDEFGMEGLNKGDFVKIPTWRKIQLVDEEFIPEQAEVRKFGAGFEAGLKALFRRPVSELVSGIADKAVHLMVYKAFDQCSQNAPVSVYAEELEVIAAKVSAPLTLITHSSVLHAEMEKLKGEGKTFNSFEIFGKGVRNVIFDFLHPDKSFAMRKEASVILYDLDCISCTVEDPYPAKNFEGEDWATMAVVEMPYVAHFYGYDEKTKQYLYPSTVTSAGAYKVGLHDYQRVPLPNY